MAKHKIRRKHFLKDIFANLIFCFFTHFTVYNFFSHTFSVFIRLTPNPGIAVFRDCTSNHLMVAINLSLQAMQSVQSKFQTVENVHQKNFSKDRSVQQMMSLTFCLKLLMAYIKCSPVTHVILQPDYTLFLIFCSLSQQLDFQCV